MTTAVQATPWAKPTARGLRLVIPARFNPYIRPLLASWLVFWAAAEIFIALGWLGVIAARIPSAPIWIVFVLGFTAAGAYLAFHLAWVVYGRETLTLRDGVFTIARGLGRWTGHPRSYPWSEVRDLQVGSYEGRVIYPEWGRLFLGKGGAHLRFTHRGRVHAFARGLSREEAEDLLRQLENESTRAPASGDSRR